jgi:hypothetical protein
MQRALERRVTTRFVGTSWVERPGYGATDDISSLAAGLPEPVDFYLHVDSGMAWYFPRGLTQLPCPTACYLIDVHVGPKVRLEQAMFFDYAFSAQRDFVEVLRQAGHPQAHLLPLACDPEIHCRYDLPKRYDIGFVGATGGGYARRTRLLEHLSNRFSVSDYRRSYAPAEMARVYSESRLVFNCSLRHEVNMRVFEGPATGSLLLTDRIGNGLSDLVRDREHVVMYDDDTLVDLAEEYLRDEAAREQLAMQGYEHMKNNHTYDHRVNAILEAVFERGAPSLNAPLRHVAQADVELAYAGLYSLVARVDDTVLQFKRVPPERRYRLPAAKHLLFCLLRRVKYG